MLDIWFFFAKVKKQEQILIVQENKHFLTLFFSQLFS